MRLLETIVTILAWFLVSYLIYELTKDVEFSKFITIISMLSVIIVNKGKEE